jgi:hypothetical protein
MRSGPHHRGAAGCQCPREKQIKDRKQVLVKKYMSFHRILPSGCLEEKHGIHIGIEETIDPKQRLSQKTEHVRQKQRIMIHKI